MQRLLLVAIVAGCTHQEPAPPAFMEPSLMQPLQVTATHPAAETSVSFDISSWQQGSTAHLALSPTDLRLVVRTGGHGEITGLELPLADQDISAQAMPPSGLKLRNLQLGLDGTVPVETRYSSDDYLELHADAALRLAWSVVLSDGSIYALGPAVTSPLSFDVQLERSDTDVTARVYARCDGDCWTLDGVARIANGQLHLVASADVKPLD
jgi:hypothetical protein